MKLVSVVIPTYQSGKYLEETLTSIFNQTYDNFEVIICDDASTDDTLAILERYKDPRLRIVRNDNNLGPEKNWNKALSHATGDYVKLVCADDLLLPTCLAQQVAILDNHPDIALVSCPRRIIDSNSKVLIKSRGSYPPGQHQLATIVRANVVAGTNIIGEPAVGLFRREVYKQGVRYRGRHGYAIDVDYWCQILKYGDLFILPEPLCAFRISKTSWSFRIGLSQAREFRVFIRHIAQEYRAAISPADQFIGKARALINCGLRWVYFQVYA